jgi:hypothetical protein
VHKHLDKHVPERPVSVFNIENRRGKFTLSRDIAKWLATQKINNVDSGGFIEKKL